MPTKIRLQRFGKKGYAYYHIVVADSRAPRDGKIIERIGSYNPNTNPATIEVDRDKATNWLSKGAQPSDTARAILSYRGVMYKHHLLKGVNKGVLTLEEAEAKLSEWDAQKGSKIEEKQTVLAKSIEEAAAKRHSEESKVRETREKALKEKMAAATIGAEATEEAPAAEAKSEAPAAEAKPEAPAAEAKPEAPAAEATPEAPAAEAKPEAPTGEGDDATKTEG